MQTLPPSPSRQSVPAQSASSMRRVPSGELMAGNREIVILHAGQEYHLRVTNAGKLILTK
jgi:hemin uptake protein HemP